MHILPILSCCLIPLVFATDTELSGYPSYSSVLKQLQDIALSNPTLATYESIGNTRSGLEIPSLAIHFSAHLESAAVDLRPYVLLVAQVQPREVLSLVTILEVVEYLVRVSKEPTAAVAKEDKRVLDAVKSSRIVIVPMVNPEGYEELRLKYPQFKEEVMKNGAPGCAGGDISTNGVNLGHNWDFEWNYPVISQEDFSDPCSPAYRGSEPFSEPETRALRDLILKYTPKSVLILHSRHTSQESRLIVPFMFHKSTFLKSESTPKNAKLKLLSDKDIDTYSLITDSMQSLFDGEFKDSAYSVGTSWETIGKTISGSDLDWIFDNTGAFSLVLQIGTSKDESYWPSQKDVPKLIKKHVNPIMEFIHQSATLPKKTTSKTANSALLKHFSWIPLYLGVALFIVISSVLVTSWCLGYDKVWARFKTWAKRVERQLHNRRKQYIGLRRANGAGSSSPANRNQDVGLLPTRSSNANANAAAGSSTDGGIGSSSSRVSISTDDELELMEDLVHDEDDDDEGVGFSYRA